MDMAMPEMDGVQATAKSETPAEAAILMLSMYAQENYVRNAFDAGAQGYILKNASDIDLASAIKDVANGRRVFDPGLVAAEREPDDLLEKLTPREKQILQLIAEGNSNKEIAAMLSPSVNTVAVRRANLIDACDVHRAADWSCSRSEREWSAS